MTRDEKLTKLIKKHGKVRSCLCGDYAVPSTDVFVEEMEEENNEELILLNFPVFECFECGEITFNPKDYTDYKELALEHYKETGEKEFDCSNPEIEGEDEDE